ncbi:hypothetical protein SAHL_09625 [Salinisphaera orenii YIM 95161]|uniref:Alginate export domain-containing protein n=1 Tax=Salinisphaera orenii YIM 95161 TaxID=1051139 RepID=A0A423PTV5_9GAMM|nr:hypothetical protein SAHL_09625 [Salinisphaera halophila YIM 95161]
MAPAACLLGLAAMGCPALSAHAGPNMERSRPLRPGPPRYLENYDFLADSSKHNDFFDPIRYIPVSDSSWLQFGGGFRYRYEDQNDPGFGLSGVDNDSYWQQRIQLHADLHLFDDALRAFVQLENTESWGKETFSPYDESNNEVHQAFLDFGTDTYSGGRLTARVGRQEMAYGEFVNTTPRAVPNVRLAFDGVRLMYADPNGYKFNAFATRPVGTVQEGSFNDTSNDSGDFYGLYATLPLTESIDDDVYYYGYRRDAAVFNGVPLEENRQTVGNRIYGAVNNVDFTLDTLYQFGDRGDQDIQAWGMSSSTGYTFNDVTGKPGVALRFDAASGDDNPDDGESNTFDPLFPANGKFYGNASLTTLSNLIAVGPQFAFAPTSSVTVSPTILALWRESDDDAAYVPGMRPIAGTAGVPGSRLGTSYQMFVRWAATANLTFDLEYLYYDVGEVIQDVGGDDTQYASIRASFLF